MKKMVGWLLVMTMCGLNIHASQIGEGPTKTVIIRSPHQFGEDHLQGLEITSISLKGEPISLNKEFEVEEAWLEHLKITVRNSTRRPIYYIGIRVGLFHSLDEELAPHESWKYGIGYEVGNHLENSQVPRPMPLLPGAEIELTGTNITALSRRVIEKAGGFGEFRKAQLWNALIRYADGKTKTIELSIGPKLIQTASWSGTAEPCHAPGFASAGGINVG